VNECYPLETVYFKDGNNNPKGYMRKDCHKCCCLFYFFIFLFFCFIFYFFFVLFFIFFFYFIYFIYFIFFFFLLIFILVDDVGHFVLFVLLRETYKAIEDCNIDHIYDLLLVIMKIADLECMFCYFIYLFFLIIFFISSNCSSGNFQQIYSRYCVCDDENRR
jgi:hypothetical protein